MKEKITKYRYDTRNDFKDKKLNYKELVMQVEKTYFVLQKAWTKNEINLAKVILRKNCMKIINPNYNGCKYQIKRMF